MKQYYLLIAIFYFCICNAQVEKGHWLIGGNASFSYSSYKAFNSLQNEKNTTFTLELSPNVGYFVIDKLAVGMRASYNQNFATDKTSNPSDFSELSLDPFVRYYFLPIQQKLNLFAETSYRFYIKNPYTDTTTLSSKVGVDYFVNDVVAYELALQYLHSNFNNSLGNKGQSNVMLLSLGLQIFLEKQK